MKKFLIAVCACLLAIGAFALVGCGPAAPSVKVGDSVTMGKYNNKDLTWTVLDVQGNKALIMTDSAVGRFQLAKTPTEEAPEITNAWDVSVGREFLNGDFLKKAFSDDEAKKIAETAVDTNGTSTTDKIFLLSKEEFEKYFASDEERAPKGDRKDWCWTRTPASNGNKQIGVHLYGDGKIADPGFKADSAGGMRPAMWITA